MKSTDALAVVRPQPAELALRVSRWLEGLQRLGAEASVPLVHDLGLLLTVPATALEIRGSADSFGPVHAQYARCVRQLLDHPAVDDIRALKPNDDIVTLILAKVLPLASRELHAGRGPRGGETADLDILRGFVQAFASIQVTLDVLDVDTLRLLRSHDGGADGAIVGTEGAGALGSLLQVDALAALDSADAAEVVRFSLELLPAVLEDARRTSVGTHPFGGYQGLTHHASIDSLVPSELAWPDAELVRRLLEDEVVYYARERSDEPAPRIHLVLVDASASMRGERTTFARGVAIALLRRLELAGEESRIRFFDGRLYEAVACGHGSRRSNSSAVLPHVLSFRGERGRSPERVLRQLVAELDLLRARDRRAPVVHLLTHGAFYAPRALMAEVRARASVHAAFMVPDPLTGAAARGAQDQGVRLDERGEPAAKPPVDLDWLDLLDGWTIVDASSLASGRSRTERAREVVARLEGSARAQGRRGPPTPAGRSHGPLGSMPRAPVDSPAAWANPNGRRPRSR